MARQPHWRDTVIGATGNFANTALTVRGVLHLAEGRFRGGNALSDRFELKWVAGQRGKPGINADIQNAAESVRMIADPDFEVLGTNGTTALSTFNAEGGLTFTTATTSGDQMILVPHLDTTQTVWTATTWGTDQQVEWECFIKTTADIAAVIIWAGLKLTNTSVIATDDNQAMFRFSDADAATWRAITSRAGTDTNTSTGVTVAASTKYHLAIKIDAQRIPRFYINGLLVVTGAALTDAIDLIPYIGVQTAAADAVGIDIYGQAISRIAG
jgi:hypothetical protein